MDINPSEEEVTILLIPAHRLCPGSPAMFEIIERTEHRPIDWRTLCESDPIWNGWWYLSDQNGLPVAGDPPDDPEQEPARLVDEIQALTARAEALLAKAHPRGGSEADEGAPPTRWQVLCRDGTLCLGVDERPEIFTRELDAQYAAQVADQVLQSGCKGGPHTVTPSPSRSRAPSPTWEGE